MDQNESLQDKELDKKDLKENMDKKKLEYGVDDIPPLGLSLSYVVQVTFGIIGGPLTCAYFLYLAVCPQGNQILLAQLMSTSLVVVGVTTFIQSAFGVRLPLIQGSSIIYILPAMGLASSGVWPCPDIGNSSLVNETGILEEELWRPRINAVSGAIALAGIVHACLGLFGIIGILVNYIGPLSIGTLLLGLVVDATNHFSKAASICWIISGFTAGLNIIFALFLDNVQVPVYFYNKKKGFHIAGRYPLFKLYSVAFSIAGGWILSIILTYSGYYTSDPTDPGYMARSDAKIKNIHQAAWIYIPYPGQYGWPTFNVSLFMSMLAATVASVTDSVGDYGICARICFIKSPPIHAVNRGIAIEGIGTIFAGLVGAAHATSTYTGTLGLVAITEMGSRRVYQLSGLFLIFLGIFGKFGGLFSTIPAAVIGGKGLFIIGMLAAIAISTVTSCDFNIPRNRMVFAASFGPAIIVSYYVSNNPESIKTGIPPLDETLRMVLGTCMFLSAILAILFDNITPGSREVRGMESLEQTCSEEETEDLKLYDLPFGMRFLKKHSIFSYIPFLPVYQQKRKAKAAFVDNNNNDKIADNLIISYSILDKINETDL